MAVLNRLGLKVNSLGAGIASQKSLPRKLGAILFIQDLTYPINGYFRDSSGYSHMIQAATTTTTNDSLIMPANDTSLISALTLAGCYSVFYTTDSTPKKVKISDILQVYGTSFYFDKWNNRRLTIFAYPLSLINHTSMINFINPFINGIQWGYFVDLTEIINLNKSINL